MINVTDLRAGTSFKDQGNLWEVLTYEHSKIGRGSANIKVKVRNLKTGATIDRSFTSGARVEELDVEKNKAQFLYTDATTAHFMNQTSYEQFNLPLAVLSGSEKFLKEGDIYELIVAEGEVLNVELPRTITLTISETGPAVKGDTVSNAFKSADLENGMSVQVPLFIKAGDRVKVDTRSGEYIERVRN